MFEQKDNIVELIIIKYRNAKDALQSLYTPENMVQVIDTMRVHDDLEEGRCIKYLQKKIDSGVELSDEESEEVYSTLTLHQNVTLIDENGNIALEE